MSLLEEEREDSAFARPTYLVPKDSVDIEFFESLHVVRKNVT